MSRHAPLSVLADQAEQIIRSIRELGSNVGRHFVAGTMDHACYYRTLESLDFADHAMVLVEIRLRHAAAAGAAKASDAAIAADGRA